MACLKGYELKEHNYVILNEFRNVKDKTNSSGRHPDRECRILRVDPENERIEVKTYNWPGWRWVKKEEVTMMNGQMLLFI